MPQPEQVSIPITSSSSSTGQAFIHRETPTAPATRIEVPLPPTKRQVSRTEALDAETAVFLHIKAIRSMGRTSVNSIEIAQSLGISHAAVVAAIIKLQNKGIKVAG
jgi:hypothetical protein